MTPTLARLSPSITSMIRFDHQHVLTSFRRFKPDTPLKTKQGLVNTILLALEVHAQLEEEIFYPALRAAASGSEADVLGKSKPEHDEMRQLISKLRDKQPEDADYDATFLDLIRLVLHHVADEETVLLPLAERVLADQLSELGAAMTKRRLQLLKPRLGELAVNAVRAVSPTKQLLLVGAGVLLGGYAASLVRERRHTHLASS